LWQRTNKTGLGRAALLRLARADAFRSLGLGAREAYWEIKALRKEILPFDLPAKKQLPTLPYLPEQQAMFNDYQATGLSLRGHPVGLLRENLTARGVSSAYQLKNQRKVPCNTFVGVAGIAIIRQRPGTAKGVVFITLEDESGVTNLLLKPDIFERYSKLVLSSSALLAYGKLERIGEVVYVDVQELQKLDLERSPKRYCRAYPRRNA
ncbi:MAG: hypothetical protein KDD42_06040, partial [Bdellovibrionales bacterium]|nr:hypothetical protein [Bdellovibrionales bacterium]